MAGVVGWPVGPLCHLISGNCRLISHTGASPSWEPFHLGVPGVTLSMAESLLQGLWDSQVGVVLARRTHFHLGLFNLSRCQSTGACLPHISPPGLLSLQLGLLVPVGSFLLVTILGTAC